MSQPAPMLQVADRVVGAGQPAFVIAEIGVNHDGSLHKALELVEIATFHVPIGYSDHTTSLLGGALAVAAGACIVERHLTSDCTAVGPDHAASSDPRQFADYVALIREAERFRGQAGKRVLPIEEEVRRVSRQSLVLRRAMQVGQTLTEQDLTVQRPGSGVPAATIGRAVGRRIVRAARAGTMLEWDMLADVA